MKSRRKLTGGACAILLAIITFAGPARAQQPPAGARATEPDAAPQEQKHWIKKLADAMVGYETVEYARSHASVLSAFRDSVALPSKCTVRIWCDARQVALGTVVESEGFIVTKSSELDGKVVCELSDGSRYDAKLVGVDRASDLALLKIPASGLPAIRWSDADPPAVGGWVVTPGMGSLPLAIGIVSVAPHRVRGGVLGIQMAEDDPGPRITYVVPGSGATDAGLAKGDIIVRANGKEIETSDDMVAMTSSMLPGEKVEMTILRLGEKKRLAATLGSLADTLTSPRARFQNQLGGPLSKRRVLFPSALEHDTVLAPQECGGVLVNLDGEAIGVNIARSSRISSFAIPASVARPILESLRSRASRAISIPVAAQTPAAPLPAAPLVETAQGQ